MSEFYYPVRTVSSLVYRFEPCSTRIAAVVVQEGCVSIAFLGEHIKSFMLKFVKVVVCDSCNMLFGDFWLIAKCSHSGTANQGQSLKSGQFTQ